MTDAGQVLALLGAGVAIGLLAAAGITALLRMRPRGRHHHRTLRSLRDDLDDDDPPW